MDRLCVVCGHSFVFSETQKARYAAKGWKLEPRRCPACRLKRRVEQGIPQYAIVCACCGCDTTVSFRPMVGRPAFCVPCYG